MMLMFVVNNFMNSIYKKTISIIILWSVVLLPTIALAQAANTELENPLGEGTQIWDLFARIAAGLSFVAGTLALLFVVIGGYMILTARGNDEQYRKGKNTISYAIVGMLVIVGSYQILTTVINVLTGAAIGAGGLPELTKGSTFVDPLGITSSIQSGQSIVIFYGQRIIGYMVNLLGVAVVAMYVYGGTIWMMSAGSEERVQQAKKVLTYATIGAAVVLGSYIIIKFVYAPFAALIQ